MSYLIYIQRILPYYYRELSMNPATNTKYKILFIMFSFALLLTGFIIFIQITHFTEHTRRMLIEKKLKT